MSEPTVDVQIRAQIAKLQEGMQAAVTSVRTSTAEMKAAFVSLREVTEAATAGFALLTGVLAGGKAFKDVIDTTREWTGEVVALARRLGLSTEEASGLAVALHHVGINADDYATLAGKMTRQMRQNQQAFDDLGVRTKQQNGEWRNTQDVMADAIDKLNGLQAGTDRNIAAAALFGARVGNLGPILRLTSEMLEESREKAAAFGLVVGPEGAAQAKQYKDAMAEVKLAWLALENLLGRELLPTLTELAQWLAKDGPSAVLDFREVLGALTITGELLAFVLNEASIGAQWFGKTLHAISIGDLGAVRAAWAEQAAATDRAFAASKAKIDAIQRDLAAAEARVKNPSAYVTAGTRGTGRLLDGSGLTGTKDDAKKQAKEAYEARAAGYKEEEDLEREHLDRVLAIRQRAYADAVRTFGVHSKEALTALREVHAAERALQADDHAAAELATAVFRDGVLAKLQIQRDALAQQKAFGTVSAADALRQERWLADQEYAIRLAALQDALALEAERPAKVREINAEIERLRQQHAVAVAKTEGEQAAAVVQSWQGVASSVGNGLTGALQSLAEGTGTLRDSVVGVFRDIERQLTAALGRMVARWAAHELAKTGATAAGTAARLAIEAAAFAKSLALAIVHGLKFIAVEAAKAAAATYSAMTQLGLPGVIAAPVLAGAALFTVLNYGKKIASAAGGYDIPAGVNPVTQLHAQEMVLPAPLANAVRDMAAGGGAGGGGPVHLHLHAADGRSARRFLLDNHEAVAEAVRKAVRDNLIDAPG